MENNNSLCRHGLENIPARAFVSLMQRFPLPVQCDRKSSQQLPFSYVASSDYLIEGAWALSRQPVFR
jgi:hypothetical protein